MFRQTPKYATSAFFGLALALIACGDPRGSTSHSATCHDADKNKSTATSTATAQQSSGTAAPTPPASANPNATTTSAQPAVIDSNTVSADTLKLQLEEKRKILENKIASVENMKGQLANLSELQDLLNRVNHPDFEKTCVLDFLSLGEKCALLIPQCDHRGVGPSIGPYRVDQDLCIRSNAAKSINLTISAVKKIETEINQYKAELAAVEEKLKSLAHTLNLNQD